MGDIEEIVEHYKGFGVGDETTLVVRGATVQEVVEALGGVPIDEVPEEELDGEEPIWAAYTLSAIAGGVLASEDTGYADPPVSVLVALSKGGRAAAVVRDNIQAHCRFGGARDGVLLFDDDEYIYIDDPHPVPAELRPLFDLAWVDLSEGDGEPLEEDSTAVAMAMAEVVTGIRLTPADAARHEGDETTVVAVRQLQYGTDAEEPERLSVPEAAEGLAASQRIGRDVDGRDGARSLSGELGSVEVVRTVRGTRRKLFLVVSHATSWSHVIVGDSSWIYGGGAETYALEAPHYLSAGGHPDGLTGREARLKFWFTEVDRPRRAVRGWNWILPVTPGGSAWEGRHVLPVDTKVTVTLDEKRDAAGDPWTTITLRHEHLPVEWVDDMRAWWTLQLAIMEAVQESKPRHD